MISHGEDLYVDFAFVVLLVNCNRRKYVQSTLDKISTSLSWFHICILFKIRSDNEL